MSEDKLAGLLRLRDKVCLTPKPNYRLQSLETYLSALYTLNFFSQDEKEKLNAQFNELSEQDRQDLCDRITNKTMTNFFHLTYDEMEELQAGRKELSFHERARLFSDLILTATGTAWLDLGDVFEAQIEIDDTSSPDSKIEADLLAFEKQPYSDLTSHRITTTRVMEFLRDEGAKGGKRFVGNNEEGISLRPSWKVFRNAFAAWFFDIDQGSVQDYLEKAAKLNLDDDVYQYSWAKPRTSIFRIFHYLLVKPLVIVREPVTLSESDIDFEGIEGTISRANIDTEEEGGQLGIKNLEIDT